ncbi:MAG: hypothetical protein Q4A01_10905, partial [Coriobacteriales bacterium]|nr:hypothetical protein [Coriobacteriales bacterium]
MADHIDWNDVTLTGTEGFQYLRESMRGDMTDDEIAARNQIPTTAPDGTPHRIIAEEYMTENEDATHYKPASPDDPGPAAALPLKPGVLREAKKITDRIPVKLG